MSVLPFIEMNQYKRGLIRSAMIYFHHKNNSNAALACIEKAIAIKIRDFQHRDCDNPYYLLALIACQKKENPAAILELLNQQNITLFYAKSAPCYYDEVFEAFLTCAAYCIQQKNPSFALKMYKLALAKRPDFVPAIAAQLRLIKTEFKDFWQVKTLAEKILKLDPENEMAWEELIEVEAKI